MLNELAVRLRRWRWLGILGALVGYIPLVVTFIVGEDRIYWYTMHNNQYGGFHAKEINEKFGLTLVIERPPKRSRFSLYYSAEDVDLRTLFIKNNSNSRLVNYDSVRFILCPFPKYFVTYRSDFAVFSENELGGNCGMVRNIRPIRPGQTSRIYFFSPQAPEIIEDSRSSANLSSGERMLSMQLVARSIMFFAAFIIFVSGIAPLTGFVRDLIVKAVTLAISKVIYSAFEGGVVLRIASSLIALVVSVPGLAHLSFGPILWLSDHQLAGDYDKDPNILVSGMRLIVPEPSKRQLIAEATPAGRHEEAFALQQSLVADTEKAETASVGSPGVMTAIELGDLSWHALLARKFGEALAAAERGLSLAPQEAWIETNRAHALLLLGRVDEARALYLARKGKRLSGGRLWEVVIREDFDALRKASIEHPAFIEIEASMAKR